MFGMVLNMPLDYLSCFDVVLREILRICQNEYSIYSKISIFPLFRSHKRKYNIQANKTLTKVKAKWQLFNLMFLIFLSLSS